MAKLPHTPPEISVDGLGQVKWTAPALDYNSEIFYRGKTVTNTEFNELFLKQTAQSNYGIDSFKKFLTEIFPQAVYRQVKSKFNFDSSYIRPFVSEDWRAISEDEYYIQIPVSEHGFDIDTEITSSPNIEVEMYAFDPVKNSFYRVNQVSINEDNTVVLYSDIVDLIGYVIIRINRKVYAIASQEKIDASQISGLANVALTGDYNDLLNSPNAFIEKNTNDIQKIIDGSTPVAKAQSADTVNYITKDTTFNNIAFTDIFEEGSSYVKNATQAKDYDTQAGTIKEKFDSLVNLQEETKKEIIDTLIPKITEVENNITDITDGTTRVPKSENATYAMYASSDITKGTIEERLSSLGFKPGVIKFMGVDYGSIQNTDTTRNGIYRLGNFVIGKLLLQNLSITTNMFQQYLMEGKVLIELPDNFRPISSTTIMLYAYEPSRFDFGNVLKITIDTQGIGIVEKNQYVNQSIVTWGYANIILNFGYEAAPIK